MLAVVLESLETRLIMGRADAMVDTRCRVNLEAVYEDASQERWVMRVFIICLLCTERVVVV